MKRYFSIESTPLNFHKAFYKVISPILIVIRAILLLATIGHFTGDDGYYDSGSLVFNLLFCVLSIIFLSFMTYGFAKKKEYAWYMVYADLGLGALSNIIHVAPLLYYDTAFALGYITPVLIIFISVGVYYYKRKPLFVISEFENYDRGTHMSQDQAPQTQSPQNYMPQNNVQHYSNPTPNVDNKATVRFCRKCGNRVTNDSVFCNKCGSKITWN